MVKKLGYIFSQKEKMQLVGIFALQIMGSFVELLGVSAFLPFIQILLDPTSIQTNELLNYFYTLFGFTSVEAYLSAIAAMIGIVYLFKNIYLTFMQNAMLSFTYKTRMNLATRLLTTYMSQPYTFHLGKNIAELQRNLQYDTSQFMLLANAVLQLCAECAVIGCLGIYLFNTSHSITIVIMILLALCVGTFFVVSKKVSTRIGRENEEYNAKLFQWINQSLGGIKEVKVLNREGFFVNSYTKVYKKLIKGAKNNEILAALPKYIVETVCMIGMLIAIVIKMYYGRNDFQAFVVQLSAFAVAAFRLLPSVGKVNAYINNIMYSKASLDLIYRDLKEIENYKMIDFKEENEVEKWNLGNKIELRDIEYHYPDSNKLVLSNINFSINKGETIALIGSSGAGKTTLADILLGLLQPVKGTILVDGKDIYDNMDAWHRMLGYIPQTIYLSDDTIRNNIAFGIVEEDIDDDAIMDALKKAQLYDFVQTLDKGLDTFVGDRGVRLSGGQRQRIGIARALYYNPEILILDEATSALDNETETAVMEAIESLKGMKTMVIIAHRLTTLKNADVIYEVVEGNIVERSKEILFG